MRTIQGPGVFLAQFAADDPPYNSLASLAEWAAAKGFEGVQIPTWDTRLIDMAQAADSATYCDEIEGLLADHGLKLIEFASHTTGQLVAVHPAHDAIWTASRPPRSAAGQKPAAPGRKSSYASPPRRRSVLASTGM